MSPKLNLECIIAKNCDLKVLPYRLSFYLFYSPFPWINLVDAQTKMTPLSDLVSGNKSLQDCFSFTFHNSFSNLLGPKDA